MEGNLPSDRHHVSQGAGRRQCRRAAKRRGDMPIIDDLLQRDRSAQNAGLFRRLDRIECKLLQGDEDERLRRRRRIQPCAASEVRRARHGSGLQGFLNGRGPQDLGYHERIVIHGERQHKGGRRAVAAVSSGRPVEQGEQMSYSGAMEWRASHILVKDKKLADELLRRVKRGASFEALAREHSTCPSKSRGGDLGWFGPGKMVPAFENACKRLSPGSTSDVVSSSFGYHIIRLTGRKE